MVKVKKRVLGLALVGVMSIGSLVALGSEVKAEERFEYSQPRNKGMEIITVKVKSKEGQIAYNKIKHIINSIQKNYAGIKNQVTWEGYIREARALIKKIPSRYSEEIKQLTEITNDLENLVTYVAKINHVEKSYEVNYRGIKNAGQWIIYIEDASSFRMKLFWDYDILEVLYDKKDEVYQRERAISNKVHAIVDAHNAACDAITEKYNKASETRNLALAQEALADANKLGTHKTTTELKNKITALINTLK